MTSPDTSDQGLSSPVPDKKTWTAPEIRDQTIKSITEAKSVSPNESSPNSGPS